MHDEVMRRKRFWNTQTNKRKHIQTHTQMDRANSICPSAILWRKLFRAHHLIILYICAKGCQSISNGFRVTDLNSRVDVCTGTPFTVEKNPPRAGLELGTARSAGQRLTYWATGASANQRKYMPISKFVGACHKALCFVLSGKWSSQ